VTGLTVERRDLRDAVRGLIGKTWPAKTGADRSPWRRLCDEIGVAGLAIPERYGGAGAGMAEVCVVMEELGRNLTPSPMLGSAVLAAQAVLASGDDAACARLLPAIADGSSIAALAWTTPAGHWDAAELACEARPVGVGVGGGPGGGGGPGAGGGWELDGEAHYVLDGEAADVLLVAASAPDGTGLFEVSPRQDGVARAAVATMDASRGLAVVRLTGARGRRVGGDAAGPLAFARDQACIALGAEQVGAAQGALELTVAHLLTRVQFGQVIGGFQALQHRAADLYVLIESARSLSRAVASAADEADGAAGRAAADPGPGADPNRGLRAAAVKVYCSEALTQTAGEMIQLHGAIGVTWEHQAHRYLKRAHSGRHLFGSPSRHLAAIAASLIDR
jgi:alkylation response protein AidB-like acyl-CoA dehydrogenase